MRGQRYTSPIAQERMEAGTCPECGKPAEAHSGASEFWLRPIGCDLLPHSVEDRIAQHRTDLAASSSPASSGTSAEGAK